MRVFVFLLILANLLFLAWTKGYLGSPSNPDALRAQNQLLADQVKVVSRDVPPVDLPPPSKPEKIEKPAKPEEIKQLDLCLSTSDLPVLDVVRFENLLGEKLPAFKSIRSMNEGTASYWVFIPPLANKRDADKKVVELNKINVPELFVVQESGPNNLAISLGIFSTKEAADDRLSTLRDKGVKSAKVGVRTLKPATASLEIHGPEEQAEALRQVLSETLPGVKPFACKTPATPAQ